MNQSGKQSSWWAAVYVATTGSRKSAGRLPKPKTLSKRGKHSGEVGDIVNERPIIGILTQVRCWQLEILRLCATCCRQCIRRLNVSQQLPTPLYSKKLAAYICWHADAPRSCMKRQTSTFAAASLCFLLLLARCLPSDPLPPCPYAHLLYFSRHPQPRGAAPEGFPMRMHMHIDVHTCIFVPPARHSPSDPPPTHARPFHPFATPTARGPRPRG